ncbi:MAG: alpha-amylase family glycosyl hydrolase [Bacteriovoracia bacterium]
MEENLLWWQKGIIYQIYPRSFKDTNHDGIGDLQGIISKIDYLNWLGVDIVWLSPINPSPMKDFGYDISDYCGIHELFGTMEDFDELLEKLHASGIKLILDFVPNHTSDEHPWFQESRSSRDNPKRDWYIWKDPGADGGPPNNWLSNFGGPAWTLDKKTGQYYYHAFLKEQPDLNWRNEEVQKAMFDALRFWLEKGVDGFRVDVIWHIIKDEQFRDNPLAPEYEPHLAPHRKVLEKYSSDQPEVHDIIEKMRHVLDSYHERMMVGEIYLPIDRLVAYYGSEGEGVHLPFNFHLVHVPWTPRDVASVIDNYESSLPDHGWPNWVLGNHDNHRLASRFGSNQVHVAGMLLLTLRGTPTMYYGDEIGMHDVHIPPDAVQDPFEKNVPGMGHGRDPERTPMQWNDEEYAGFSEVKPWLPVASDYKTYNVKTLREFQKSCLNFYKRLLDIRSQSRVLQGGDYQKHYVDEHLFAYIRSDGKDRFLIVLNFCPEEYGLNLKELSGEIILSTKLDREHEEVSGQLKLRSNEGVLIHLKAA